VSEDQEVRLRRLEDVAAIQQLFVDYCASVDAGDSAGLAGLFAAAGEIKLGRERSAIGPLAIEEVMARYLDGTVGKSFHIVSSPQIQLDGDRATARVMWTVIDASGDDGLTVRHIGHHRDELVREAGIWKFALRKAYIDAPRV
jgi:SnoaL-like protein